MNIFTLTTDDVEVIRVDHQAGGCTIIFDAPDWNATMELDAKTLRKAMSKMKDGGQYDPSKHRKARNSPPLPLP